MALVGNFLSGSHKKMAIDGVYSVAVESCLGPEACTQKFFNFGDETDRESYRVCKNLSASQRETLVHRVALQEWHYDQFYINSVLRYCKESKMIDQPMMVKLLERRTANKTNLSTLGGANSTLGQVIREERYWLDSILKFFHYDF